jgi:hypothetical protein
MTIANTNVVAKVAAVVAGLGLVLASFAPVAKADTTSDLQAQIASLLAQISSLQAQLGTTTTTSSSSMMFTTDLTIGSTGASVTALQNWLISKGFTISAGATGYFGAQTKAALAAYQAANGISPAAGYFGPITRAKVNAAAGSTTTTTTGGTTTTTTTGTLSGNEGSIDNFKVIGATNTSLNASDSDTVYGFEFKAGGSDLAVNRIDFDIYNSNGTGSTHPWNVFDKATLMNGTHTVATVDASNSSNWSEDGTVNSTQQYRIRFDGLNDVVKMGNTVDYYLMLSTQGGISNSNSGGTYSITLGAQGVRAVDAKGIQQYSTSGTSYNTVSVDNSTTGTLTIGTGSSNPQTSTVQANQNSQTSDVTLASFTLQAKDADVDVFTVPVTVATTSTSASNLIRSLKLYHGSTLVDTESFSSNSSNTIKFDNLNDVTVKEGNTDTFSVHADINSVDGTTVPEGSSISVSIPSTGWDAENSNGDTITPTGSMTGNVITFRTNGFSVDSTPASGSTWTVVSNGATGQDTGTYNFVFNVTAFGQDVYVSSTTANSVLPLTVYDASGNATTTNSVNISSQADISGLGNYVIHSGQTKQVTVSFVKLGQAGSVYAKLNTLKFGTTDSNPLAATYTFPSAYRSSTQFLNAHN